MPLLDQVLCLTNPSWPACSPTAMYCWRNLGADGEPCGQPHHQPPRVPPTRLVVL